MQVTIKSIAEAAGVYPSAVSAVLNNKSYTHVSAKRRAHIRKIAKEMGYKPNFQAVCLRKKKKPVIGIFIPNWNDAQLLELINGLSQGAEKLGLPLNFYFGLSRDDYSNFLDNMITDSQSGIISFVPYWKFDYEEISAKIKKYISLGGNVVTLNSPMPWIEKAVSLRMDENHGGELVAEYFLERSCESYVMVRFDKERHQMRSNGFCEKIKAAGYEVIQLVYPSQMEFDENILRKDLNLIMKKVKSRVGIFCATRGFVNFVIAESIKHNLTINKEIQLLSYDRESHFGEFTKLPRIIQPFNEMGVLAMEKLHGLLTAGNPESEILKPSLRIAADNSLGLA
jgi:LacI family transcriptional regulator